MSLDSSIFTNDFWCNLDELRAYRYILILEGINRIFSNVVQAKTEEELGNTCLSVATEITGSQYGFIGEVGVDGRLHNIAISEMGWEKCLMYDKTGNRRPPSCFILDGLHGLVIDNKIGFFTNDPQSHPYSIGVPTGNPPISSFLGVPLIEDEKTVGIIVVANREGGYSNDQLEDLEAIAPAVTQAIKRNKAEKALHDAYEQIQSQSDELLLQSTELQVQNESLLSKNRELQIQKEELQAQSEEIQMQNEELQAQSEELNKVDEALRENKERFDLAVKVAQEGIWDWNMETDEVWYSSQYKKMLGYSEDEIGHHVSAWLRLLHPDDKERSLQLVDAVMRGERDYEIEFRLRHKDGHYLDILSRGYPVRRESDGKIVRIVGTHFDLTERKRMEEAEELRRAISEGDLDAIVISRPEGETIFTLDGADRAYRVLVETMNEGTVTLNNDCIILYCNSIFAEYLKMPVKDIIGTSIYRFIAPENSKKFKDLLDNKRGKEEIELRAKGDSLPVILSINSMQTNESPNTWCIVVTDLTEQKKNEERKKALEIIRRSEDQLWALVKNIKSGVALVDETGRFKVVNQSFMRIFGLDNEFNALNINSQDWIQWDVFDEDGKRLHVDDHPVRKAAMTGKSVKDQLVAVRNPEANGLTWLLISAEPLLKEDGHIYRVICTHHDVTELKRAEEALKIANETLEEKVKERTKKLEKAYKYNRSLIEASLDPLVTIGSDGKITDVNKATEMVTGHSRNDLIGTDFSNYFTEPDKAKEGYQEVFKKGFVSDYALEIQHKDVHITPVLYNASVYKDESDEVIGVFAAARDISERKKTEEFMAKLENTRKQEIHHRIKNNLQVISSLLDLQAEKFKGKKNIKDLEVLEAFRESQDRVISMALIHEELHKGGEIDTLNFSHYIEELTENLFLTYRLGNDGTSLATDIEEGIFFDMDTAVPLGIIINELISNSLKYAFIDRDKGEIQIKLRGEENEECAIEDCKSTTFTLYISDNGVGIPEDLDIEDLDSLGLQLVATLVDQLDAELELKRDNGTEFIIKFAVKEKDN